MDPDPRVLDHLRELFDLPADQLPDALDAIDGEDPELARELRALLDAELRARAFPGEGVGRAAPELLKGLVEEPDMAPTDPSAPPMAQCIGPWRLIRALASGGMGIVFLAERADGAFEQRVALKLLHRGLDHAELVARFHDERQILASLAHPNVARLLDGGMTAEGRPYLVMEFVEGDPIDAYADAARLSVEERLDLFLVVGRAVEHAHRKLVVHRDLKPANILVAPPGPGSGVPGEVRLLDFGIAKLLGRTGAGVDGRRPDRRPYRFLTPEYASPEMLRGEPAGVTSDVYQLGLLLRGLLRGVWPGRVSDEGPLDRRSGDPPFDEEAIARARRTTPHRLRRRLRGDLDAIMETALREDATSRYPTVQAFIDDVERHRLWLPVHARGANARLYRLGRKVRRNAGLLGAAATLLIVAGGYVASTEVHARRLGAALETAEREADRAEQVTAFLVGLIEASDPRRALQDRIPTRELLEHGVEQLRDLGGHPLLHARLREVLAQAYVNLSEYRIAGELLEEAVALRRMLEPDGSTGLARALRGLGQVRRLDGRHPEAVALFEESLRMERGSPNPDPVELSATLVERATALSATDPGEAERSVHEALELRRRALGPSHPLTTQALDLVAKLHRMGGRFADSEAIWREALELRRAADPPDPAAVAGGMVHLADLLRVYRSAPAEAELLYREALEIQRMHQGERHPDRLHGLHSLAALHFERGEYEEAEALLREAIVLAIDVYGEDSVHSSHGMGHLSVVLADQGRVDEAEDLARVTLALRVRAHGPQHPSAHSARLALARILVARGDLEEGEDLMRQALEGRVALLGEEAANVGSIRSELGAMLMRRGQHAEAEAEFDQALRILRGHFAEDHPAVRAALLFRQGRTAWP
jgi:eukaryotic-like serine/threonine-protein kinase